MTDDGQDIAEQFDEEMIGGDDPVTSDEVQVDFPPDRPVGLPFADADVTDESFADRSAQEEPEVWEQRGPVRDDEAGQLAADERLEQVIEIPLDDADA